MGIPIDPNTLTNTNEEEDYKPKRKLSGKSQIHLSRQISHKIKSHFLKSYHCGSHIMLNDMEVRKDEHWQSSSHIDLRLNCWVCENWQPILFKWTTESGIQPGDVPPKQK